MLARDGQKDMTPGLTTDGQGTSVTRRGCGVGIRRKRQPWGSLSSREHFGEEWAPLHQGLPQHFGPVGHRPGCKLCFILTSSSLGKVA